MVCDCGTPWTFLLPFLNGGKSTFKLRDDTLTKNRGWFKRILFHRNHNTFKNTQNAH